MRLMKVLLSFLTTTVIGGLLVLVPVALLGLVARTTSAPPAAS